MPQNGCDRDRSIAWICIWMPKCPIFGHNLVTDVKMPHFKGEKEMGHFSIRIHIHASDLSLSQPFWGILATLVYHVDDIRMTVLTV